LPGFAVARNRALEAQLKRGEGELAAASKHHAQQVTQLRSTFETQLGKVMDQLHAATSKADKEAEAHAATEHENASLKAKLAQQRELQKELDKMAAELAKARHQAAAADSLQKDLAHLRSEVKMLHAE
jgi:cell shape-determining protein MreC